MRGRVRQQGLDGRCVVGVDRLEIARHRRVVAHGLGNVEQGGHTGVASDAIARDVPAPDPQLGRGNDGFQAGAGVDQGRLGPAPFGRGMEGVVIEAQLGAQDGR